MRITVLLAFVGLLGACATGEAAMSRDDARAYSVAVLTEAGLDGVEVADDVTEGTYGADGVSVWRTTATAQGGSIDLVIERSGRHVRFVKDVADDGGPLLSDDQVAVIEDFSANPATDRRRDGAESTATWAVGVLVVVLVGVVVAMATGRARLR